MSPQICICQQTSALSSPPSSLLLSFSLTLTYTCSLFSQPSHGTFVKTHHSAFQECERSQKSLMVKNSLSRGWESKKRVSRSGQLVRMDTSCPRGRGFWSSNCNWFLWYQTQMTDKGFLLLPSMYIFHEHLLKNTEVLWSGFLRPCYHDVHIQTTMLPNITGIELGSPRWKLTAMQQI